MSENSKNNIISKEHEAYLRQIKLYRKKVRGTQILLLISMIILWEVAGRLGWVDPFITSQPSRIWDTLVNLHNEGTLYYHTGITVMETIVGFISGTILGTLIAIYLWWSNFAAEVLDPYLV